MKTLITATAVSVLMVTGALADCPGAGQTFTGGVDNNPNLQFHPNGGFSDNRGDNITGTNPGQGDLSDFDSGSKTDADCYTAAAVNTASGVAVSGVIVEDPSDPNAGIYQAPEARAYGPASLAIGAGAQAFREETYTDPGTDGVLGDDPLTVGVDEGLDDFEATRRVTVKEATAVGANAKAKYDNSTALGANAETDRSNQVAIGTKDDDVTVRSLANPSKVDKSSRSVVVHKADGTLASDGGQIWDTLDTHNGQITALENLATAQGAQINAHSALLSQHSARLDTQAKGIAISMALPDTWLGDKEKFAVMGNIGGFDGETAIGFGAIGRIDQTWSLNARLGADTEFKEFGWSVGARAGF